MAEAGAERRLAAIVAIDVAGYSRLMGADEEGTLATLKAHRVVTDPISKSYGGRIVGTAGDGLLLEFPSVVAAVKFAVETQAVMAERNAGIPDDQKMLYRIGTNLGDVLVDGDDIYGDGVNVAARLEALAEPGGICVSRTVRNHVRDKMDIAFADMGEIEVKNITRPVRVFRVLRDGEPAISPRPAVAGRSPAKRWIAAAAALLIVVAGGGILWWQAQRPDFEPADPKKMAFALPEKPSIAVLPFNNLSDDPKQEYFAHGIAEDIITDLSKISGLFVIARNSSFSYKDKQMDVRTIARELGVKYVLEGSVRRVGELLRINVQLVDGSTGGHLWANRYDGAAGEILTFQDRVIKKVISSLSLKLDAVREKQLFKSETTNPKAYDAFLQGWAHYIRRTAADFAEASKHFKRAIALDPDYSRAYAALASTYWEGWERWWYKQLGFDEWIGPRQQAEQYLEIALRKPTALAHQVATEVRRQQGRHEDMIHEAETAVQLDPNDPNSYIALTWALTLDGNAEDALAAVDRAMDLDPRYPAFYLYLKGFVYFSLERYEQAAEFLERALERNPGNFLGPNIMLIATYAQLGRIDAAKERLAIHPLPLSIDWVKYYWRYKRPDDMSRLADGLRQAGTPEVATKLPLPPED